MKKFVALVLILLPIFLLVAISLAGMVLSRIVIIYVDSVAFVNEMDDEITTLNIELGEEYTLLHKIYPAKATDKKVSYNTFNPDRVSIDDDGRIKGISLGRSKITIITKDGSKTATIAVEVVPGPIESVEINYYGNVELEVEIWTPLTATIYPEGLTGIKLHWESSNTGIAEIDEKTGLLHTIAEGEVTITVTVLTEDESRSVSATCIIKVVNNRAPLYLLNGTSYTSPVNTIDLRLFFGYDELLADFEDIQFEFMEALGANASIENGILTIVGQNLYVIVKARLGVYNVECMFRWNNG